MSNRDQWTAWAEKRKALADQRATEQGFDSSLLRLELSQRGIQPSDQAAFMRRGEFKPRKPAKGYPIPALCRQAGVPEPEPEYLWHPTRKFRSDFAWPEIHLLVEVDGGLFLQGGGGHNRGAALRYDMQRQREAVLLGWRTLRYTPEEIVYVPIDVQRLMREGAPQ